MSQIARQSILVLIILLVLTLLFSGYILMEKQKVDVVGKALQAQVQKLEDDAKKYIIQIKSLKDGELQYQDQIKQLKATVEAFEKERYAFNKKIKGLEGQVEENQKQLASAQESDKKNKEHLDEIRKERDVLVQKLKEKPKVIYKEVIKEVAAPKTEVKKELEAAPGTPQNPVLGSEDEYWASIVRQKAALEVELTRAKETLAKSSMEIVDLGQKNANLQLELDGLKKEKVRVDQDVKYKIEVINSLSLELARSKLNKRYVTGQSEQLNDENTALRKQIRELIAAKTGLEKTVLNLRQENDRIGQRLSQAGDLIDNKLTEAQDIRNHLNPTPNRPDNPQTGIELPAIVIESQQPKDVYNPIVQTPGYQGKVLSLNEDNNFVIVNIGESQGIKIGETLSVYHGADYIARVQVIQVRKDISAADIKEQMKKIEVGDIVR
ncbi:MAG: hypothetical protein HQL24_03675 [Candidatus Omnitrophica bacterium]|nr:hypothetical protein [Candidatus Omnitrophota bacterium]